MIRMTQEYMRRSLSVFPSVVLLIILGTPATVGSTTLTLSIDKCARISDSVSSARLLVDFGDLIALRGKEILYAKASLNVRVDSCVETSGEIDVHPISRPWAVADVSWEKPWEVAGGDFSSKFGRVTNIHYGQTSVEILLTELVQAWASGRVANYGVLLESLSADCADGLHPFHASPHPGYGTLVVKYVNMHD